MRLLRQSALKLYQRIIRRSARPWRAEELDRSAVVFSPHFDDETLGCGGTILQKRRAAADVALVFMTDGSNSHRHLMPSQELCRIRAAEGVAAAAALGVAADDVHLLGFEESRLHDHETAAVEQVTEILRRRTPQEIYIPYRREPLIWSGDHRATTRIVQTALARCGRRAIVYEYPVWFYRHWPWTSWAGSRSERTTFLKLAMISPLGLGVLCGLRERRDVADVVEKKRAALLKHRSQVEPLLANAAWNTLADVANGSFLDCFLREYELFAGYEFSPVASAAPVSGRTLAVSGK